MKIALLITMTLTLLAMTSCQPDQETTQKQPDPQQPTASTAAPTASPQQTKADAPGPHTVVTQEVIQGSSYTYLGLAE